MSDVLTNADYPVGTGSGDIRLTLTVGEGQFGTSRAKLAGEVLATRSGPMSIRVGKRSEVKGKTLVVRSIVSDVGVWVTPAYRFLVCPSTSDSCKSVIDAIAVLRAIRDRDKDTQWDFGGRVLWQANDPFTISAEVVRRRGKEGTARSSDRTVAIVEYRIREDLLLFGSFGKDFKDDDSSRTLVSILGLNFGFGAKPALIAAP